MGGKTSQSTSSVSIPPEVLARYNAVNTRAEDTAKQGFQQYSSDPNAFVSPLTAGQQAGVANTNQYANAAQPYYGAAAGMTAAGAGPINAGELNTQKYMNPFTKNVADTTQQALQQQQEQAMSGQTGNAIRSGAFGGDRSGIAAAVAQRQNQQGMAQAIAPIYERGYSQAQQTAAQQQGVGLGAEQANAARYMQAGQQLAGLGSAAQTAGLQGAQAQLAAGKEQQQTEQAGKTAMYNQFLQQQGYPFQVAQFLANIAMGTGALSGSTTTTTQPQSFFSDRRLKHDIRKIGETNDGQPIYKFKYKGDPKEQTHIGLMAQEVEKKHPEAVGLSGGYKTVDYDKATRFAEGGLVPSSMGGAVDDDVAYEGFADGGMPSLSIFGMPGGGLSGYIPGEVFKNNMSPSDLQKMQSGFMARGAGPSSKTGLGAAAAGLNEIMSAEKSLESAYKMGSSGVDWLKSKTAANGGVMGYAGGGMPYGDDDADSSNILGDVVKQGQQQHASLPKPGEAPKAPQSGIGQAVQGIGALTGGIKAAQGLYTGAGKLGSMISGLGSAAEGAGAAAGAAEGLGAAAGAAGTLGSIGSGLAAAGSTAAEILPFLALLSDERAKHDKKKVGELYDGQPVYSYKYNGDNRTQLGLMAQNVERSHPEAVGSMHGMKMVDYDRATSDAADRGHFYSGGLVPRHGYQEGGPPAEGAQEIANERRQLTDRDIDYMARTMSREAANQGDEGLSGVGHVILNRFQSGKYGADIPSIVQADKQFSPWNKEAIGTRADPRLMSTDDPSYVKSAQIARAISNGEIPDPTKGALNFANPDLTNADWVRKMAADPEAIRIGQHVFGTSKGAGTGISPARTQLAARDTGTATDAPSGFRTTARTEAEPSALGGLGSAMGGIGDWFSENKGIILPVLSGLGKMASSPSRYLGSAILQGLGGGAEAYSNLQKEQSEIAKNTLGLAQGMFVPVDIGPYKNQFYNTTTNQYYTSAQKNAAIAGLLKASGVPPSMYAALLSPSAGVGSRTTVPQVSASTGEGRTSTQQDLPAPTGAGATSSEAPSINQPAAPATGATAPAPAAVVTKPPDDEFETGVLQPIPVPAERYKNAHEEYNTPFLLQRIQKNKAAKFSVESRGEYTKGATFDAQIKTDSAKIEGMEKGTIPVLDNNGNQIIIPEIERNKAISKSNEAIPTRVDAFNKEVLESQEQVTIQRQLNEMLNKAYTSTDLGPGSDFQQKLYNIASNVPGVRNFLEKYDTAGKWNLAVKSSDYALAEKAAITEAITAIREAQAQRAPGTTLKFTMQTVPAANLSAGARYELIAKNNGNIDAAEKLNSDWLDTYMKYGQYPDPNLFVRAWKLKPENDPKVFVEKAKQRTPAYAGMTEGEKIQYGPKDPVHRAIFMNPQILMDELKRRGAQ